MLVYHGSNIEVQEPNIIYSNKFLDFGQGFYTTTYKEQAENWAMRRSLRRKGKATVNCYELNDNLVQYKILNFGAESIEWLDFIIACRKGEMVYKNYDIIIGKVADDKVFKTLNLFFNDIWDKQRAIAELKYYKENNQICFINQEVINKELNFINSYNL
jgi:hypothetical protein